MVFLAFSFACGSNDYDGALGGRELRRTPLEGEWVVKAFPYSGVSAELPSGIDMQWVYDHDISGAYIGMHAAVWPVWSPGDPQLLLEIRLDRMSREKFEAGQTDVRASGIYKRGDEESRALWDWLFAWHGDVEREDDDGYAYFRRDIDCGDGGVVKMKAELVNLRREGVAVHEAEDEAAIRRILNSVECLGVPSKPPIR